MPEFGFDGDMPVGRLAVRSPLRRRRALPPLQCPIPAHTPDSIACLIDDALFPGNSIFMPDGGTARCNVQRGDAHALYRSIRRRFELPDATCLFVCHDYRPGSCAPACETTIAEEKAGNIHVGGNGR